MSAALDTRYREMVRRIDDLYMLTEAAMLAGADLTGIEADWRATLADLNTLEADWDAAIAALLRGEIEVTK